MTIYNGFTHWKSWFSIVMLVYQRVHPDSKSHGRSIKATTGDLMRRSGMVFRWFHHIIWFLRITAIHSRNQRRAQIFAGRFQIVLISIQEMRWWSLIDSFQGVPKNHPPNFGSTLHSSLCAPIVLDVHHQKYAPFITRNLKPIALMGWYCFWFLFFGVLEHMVCLTYGLFHSMYSSMVSYVSYIYISYILKICFVVWNMVSSMSGTFEAATDTRMEAFRETWDDRIQCPMGACKLSG